MSNCLILNFSFNSHLIKGDENDVSAFKTYIQELEYSSDKPEDQMFESGKLVGTGDDHDHFQCGFKSVKLLKRVEYFNNGGVFHLDATYKIIKKIAFLWSYSVSDITRKFFPVLYMLTSKETTIDYTRFFKELLKSFTLV